MLEPAQLYKEELNREYIKTWYDDKHKYYADIGAYSLNIPDNNAEKHCFACIDKNGNITGYFSYNVNWQVKSLCNFGLISFKDNNTTLIRDVIKHIRHMLDDIGIQRVEFWAFKDNPANRGYSKLIKKFGGSKVAELHKVNMLRDGKLHDMYIYEWIMQDKSENTTEEILYTDWLSEDSTLWERLDIYRFSFRDFYTFYSNFADETAVFLAEKITDKKTDGETARKILKENERYEKEIESLRSELKKATEFNRKMEINLKIKRLEKEKTEVITNGT